MLVEALTLSLGYNAALVTVGAALLGLAAGTAGVFLFLRKRALVSDAISHATLPGVGLAFILMVAVGGDGRWLPGLLIGSALSAWIGLLAMQWLTTKTRLSEDAAIGAILSVFFGLGVVLLTLIQTMPSGRQAGLEGFLLGSTAGMLRDEALLIGIGALAVIAIILIFQRHMVLAAFDPGFAAATGVPVGRVDLLVMGLVLAVTVVGLKVVGLILIVALLIIPPVTARFWTDRAGRMVVISGVVGALAGYTGAAASAVVPDLPTGPIIVLIAFGIFIVSLLVAPERGVLAAILRHRRFQRQVHLRQGLLALATGQPIYERLTLRLLTAAGLATPDGVATEDGKARAARALRDETRWSTIRGLIEYAGPAQRYDGLTPIEDVLTPDQIAEIDARIGAPEGV